MGVGTRYALKDILPGMSGPRKRAERIGKNCALCVAYGKYGWRKMRYRELDIVPSGVSPNMRGPLRIKARNAGVSVWDLVERIATGQDWCGKCKQWLPRDKFYKDKRSYSGLRSYCMQCDKERSSRYRR